MRTFSAMGYNPQRPYVYSIARARNYNGRYVVSVHDGAGVLTYQEGPVYADRVLRLLFRDLDDLSASGDDRRVEFTHEHIDRQTTTRALNPTSEKDGLTFVSPSTTFQQPHRRKTR